MPLHPQGLIVIRPTLTLHSSVMPVTKVKRRQRSDAPPSRWPAAGRKSRLELLVLPLSFPFDTLKALNRDIPATSRHKEMLTLPHISVSWRTTYLVLLPLSIYCQPPGTPASQQQQLSFQLQAANAFLRSFSDQQLFSGTVSKPRYPVLSTWNMQQSVILI